MALTRGLDPAGRSTWRVPGLPWTSGLWGGGLFPAAEAQASRLCRGRGGYPMYTLGDPGEGVLGRGHARVLSQGLSVSCVWFHSGLSELGLALVTTPWAGGRT